MFVLHRQSLTFVSSEDSAVSLQGDSVESAVASSADGEFVNEDLENDPVEQQCTEECKPVSKYELYTLLCVRQTSIDSCME